MPSRLVPLFPLQVVVFPRTDLALHIYEDRYKAMVGEAVRDGSEFGVVLAQQDGIVNIGCTVVVERVVHTYPDGRLDILTRGRRRFEIVALNEEKSYLQGEPAFFDDDDLSPVPPDLRERCLAEARVAGLGLIITAVGMALVVAGLLLWERSRWLCLALVAAGGFALYEAARGWCFMRACGIKTKL